MKSSKSDWGAIILLFVGAAALLLVFILLSNLGRGSNKGEQDKDRSSIATADSRPAQSPDHIDEHMDKYRAEYLAKQKALSKARARQK